MGSNSDDEVKKDTRFKTRTARLKQIKTKDALFLVQFPNGFDEMHLTLVKWLNLEKPTTLCEGAAQEVLKPFAMQETTNSYKPGWPRLLA